MERISLARCLGYGGEQVETAVRQCVDLLGGISKFVRPGQRVLLKVNLLTAAPPERAVTTHPAVIEALAGLVKEAGGRHLVADSPGPVPYTEAGLRRAYRAAGLLELEEQGVVELNWDTSVVGLSHPGGRVVKRLEVIRPVVKKALTPRPVPSASRCTGCGTCYKTCPQQAVVISRGRALIDDRACIRCYCCHEMCPEAAVDIKFSLLGRAVRRFGLLGR